MSNNWEIILNNWFEKSISLETVTALNFGLSINRDLPVDFKFLAVIQAIESFHRINGKNLYMSNEDYEPIREILKKAIPESLSSAHRDGSRGQNECHLNLPVLGNISTAFLELSVDGNISTNRTRLRKGHSY